jgi:hypothetical protein
VSYYPAQNAGFIDSASAYGASSPEKFIFVIDPGSFLEDYLQTGLKEDRLNDPQRQKLFEQMIQEENKTPGFSVDPNKLNLDEYRVPGVPVHPGEFLERDRFLRSTSSPLV